MTTVKKEAVVLNDDGSVKKEAVVLNDDGSVTHSDTDEGRAAADQAAADQATKQARALDAQLEEAGLNTRETADGTMARERGSEI